MPCTMGGTVGRDPVAITTARARIVGPPSTASVCGPAKRAWPWMRSADGIASMSRTTKPTKRSRSRFTRAITSRPSMRGAPACTPKARARSMPCAASAAAISSFVGMQPTRAQVVPYGPPSISTRAGARGLRGAVGGETGRAGADHRDVDFASAFLPGHRAYAAFRSPCEKYRSSSSAPPMSLPPMNTCGVVPCPVTARSAWLVMPWPSATSS